ncbi:MAG: hypothetical protein HW387_1589 [Parachlamydiales bacterium]|nr:hypothetical protein [Parachlamydiales bacterium]
MSGLTNFYIINLASSTRVTNPFDEIKIRMDNSVLRGNYLSLRISSAFSAEIPPLGTIVQGETPTASNDWVGASLATMERTKEFVRTRFSAFGAVLGIEPSVWFVGTSPSGAFKRISSGKFSNTIRAQVAPYGCVEILCDHATHVWVPYSGARQMIDDLYQHGEIQVSDKANIAPILRELEKNIEYAGKRKNEVTQAQRDIIVSMVEEQIDVILAAAPDANTAKRWIENAAFHVYTPCEDRCTAKSRVIELSMDDLSEWLAFNGCGSNRAEDLPLYQSLLHVGRVYSGLANIEGVLAQNGPTLPSEKLVQQIIIELIEGWVAHREEHSVICSPSCS